MNIDICKICRNDDFGYCGLRNDKKELSYDHDEDTNLKKCSGFCADLEIINRRFKKDQDVKHVIENVKDYAHFGKILKTKKVKS